MYEERLSAADTKRYELEDMVVSLEEQLRTQARPVSPGTVARQATSAVEIDNEMLRDQVQHLQKKIGTLEDTLEDMRTANEHEDAAVRERIKRYKEREEATRKELAEGRQEVERARKGEEKARMRIEELEEALRENTIALENARAEVETLRNEIAVRFCHLCPFLGAVELIADIPNLRTSRASQQLRRATRQRSSRLGRTPNVRSSRRRSRSSGSSSHRLRPARRLLAPTCKPSRKSFTCSRTTERRWVSVGFFFSQVLTRHSPFSAARVAQAHAGRTRGQTCKRRGAARLGERTRHRVGYPPQEAQPRRVCERARAQGSSVALF